MADMEPQTPETYLSQSEGKWRVIHQGMPLCVDKETSEECLLVAKQFNVKLASMYWNGYRGEFLPFWLIQGS